MLSLLVTFEPRNFQIANTNLLIFNQKTLPLPSYHLNQGPMVKNELLPMSDISVELLKSKRAS
jgi:hypothetical protein